MGTPLLLLDTLLDAEITVGMDQTYQIRTGMISNIDIDGNPDPVVLNRATTAIVVDATGTPTGATFPAWRSTIPGGDPYLALSQFTLKPLNSNTARVWFRYESPIPSQFSSFMIRDGAAVREIESNFVPGTYQVIQQGYNAYAGNASNWTLVPGINGNPGTAIMNPVPNPGGNPTAATLAANSAVADAILKKPCRLRYPRPIRTIQITKTGFGAPANIAPVGTGTVFPVAGTNWPLPIGISGGQPAPVPKQDLLGMVNVDTWWNKPPGYWKLTNFATDVNVYTGTYTVQMAAESLVYQHWGQMEVISNPKTGDPVPVDTRLLKFIASLPYSYGPIWPLPVGGEWTDDGTGIIFVGMSPQTSFYALIGTDYSDNYG